MPRCDTDSSWATVFHESERLAAAHSLSPHPADKPTVKHNQPSDTRSASVRSCPLCGNTSGAFLYHPRSAPGPVSRCLRCSMVYVADIIDDHAIITNGPVAKATDDPAILASSQLDDIRDRWEVQLLPSKEAE